MIGPNNIETSGVRRTLLQVVKDRPGIHFRGLERAAQLSSVGQLRHHIDHLQRQGLIVEVEDGGYKRFFAAGQHQPKLRAGLARFSRPVPRRIATLLLKRSMTRTELRRQIGCADSTLGYHLTRMVLLGDVSKQRGRNCCLYGLTDAEFVRDILQVREENAPTVHAEAPVRPLARPPGGQEDHGSIGVGGPAVSAHGRQDPPHGPEAGAVPADPVASQDQDGQRVARWRWSADAEETTDEIGAT